MGKTLPADESGRAACGQLMLKRVGDTLRE